jgi:hypothetical protein
MGLSAATIWSEPPAETQRFYSGLSWRILAVRATPMTPCLICRNRPGTVSGGAVCERCAGMLSTDGHSMWPAKPAPEAMTEEILATLREHVARLVGGVPFERELSHEEVDQLLLSFPPDEGPARLPS